MRNYIFIFVCSLTLLFLAGCGTTSRLGELEVETPMGDKVGCTTDYAACTQTCYGTRNGFKIKKMTPLSLKQCLEARGEPPAPE